MKTRDWRKHLKRHDPDVIASREIERRDWIQYVNPVAKRYAKVERSLANAALLATKGQSPEPNEMETLSQLANMAYNPTYRAALSRIRFDNKQLEVIMPAPHNRAVFIVLYNDEWYICDTPVWPFPADN